MGARQQTSAELWPSLPYEAWKGTCQTLHMWTQIVGKVHMELSPFLNHWWHVTLYLTPRGLTTSSIPYRGSTFDISLLEFFQSTYEAGATLAQWDREALERPTK